MKILHIKANEILDIEDNCMALGYFDGLHLGHQKLLGTVIKIANRKGLKKALMTFDKHPKELFNATINPYLSTLADKIAILEEYGFDYLVVVHFDLAFSKLLPEQFIEHYIIKYQAKHIVCGFDYHFGHLGSGDIETLQKEAKQRYGVTVTSQQTFKQHKVSSTYIKELLKKGDIEQVTVLLNRHYSITGQVIYGYQRGKKELGFPTANIAYENYVIPQLGVYGVLVKIGEKTYYGMANIGFNPTFGGLQKPSLEVHIFDFDVDIYGENLTVLFYTHIRGEVQFSSKEDLIDQLHKDQQAISKYFNQKH